MVGEVVSHYRVLGKLGAGGMGEVWLAEDLKLHRKVALKLLRCPGDARAKEGLLREARMAAQLNHPGIGIVYEIDEAEREGAFHTVLAMEYVPGKTLRDHAREGPVPLPEVLRIVREVAEALAEAHARGVVHRDVKPGNVMVTESGRVKVLDFGLALVRSRPGDETLSGGFRDAETLSSPGSIVGTWDYMSPEQALGQPADARSDVFSLGVVLYELLAGRLPFVGDTPAAKIDALLHAEPPSLSRLDPALPPELDRIARKLLEKDRERRYQTMRDVCLDLEVLERAGAAGRAAATQNAVAVLSFANITRSGEHDWLGTGIAETVTSDLRCIPGLTVIGRERISEVLRKLGGGEADEKRALAAGRELGARWVVAGGYQCLAGTVRITARLMEVATGAVLRTHKLDGGLEQIFELQDRIVGELAKGLPLAPPEEAPAGDETRVVAAFEAYSKGLLNLRAETPVSMDRAILYFERAIALDPGYVRAHVELGSAYDTKATYLSMPELLDNAVACFRRAIELNPRSAEAWRDLGASLAALGRDDEGIAAIQRALDLDPRSTGAHASMGRALLIGKADFSAAAAEYERAIELNPQAGWYMLQLAHCRALLRQLPAAEAAARRAIELQEGLLSGKDGVMIVGAYTRLGQTLALGGRHEEALEAFQKELGFMARVDHALRERALIEVHERIGSSERRLGHEEAARAALETALGAFERRLRMGSDEPFTRYYVACAHALLGERAAAIEHLQKAAESRRAYTVARARREPDLESLREDPLFVELVGS